MVSVGNESVEKPGIQDLALLRDIEQRCQRHAPGLPQTEEVAQVWKGVLFRVAGRLILAPLDQVGQVLNPPADITAIPGTKPWVVGVANNRGTLLPIYDLQGFLTGLPSVAQARNRVLAVRQDELPFGLLVGDVIGIRNFEASARMKKTPILNEAFGPFIVAGFESGGDLFPVFSLERLALDVRFNQTPA